MKYKTILIVVIISILIGCKFVSNEISENFETINNSLVGSNNLVNNNFESVYLVIDSNRTKNIEIASKADSIYFVVNSTYKYIDSLKYILQSEDTTGMNTEISSKLLVNGSLAKNLTSKLLFVSEQTYKSLIDQNNIQSLDSVLNDINQIKNDKKWTNTHFGETPTIAAITILSKFQSDIKNAGLITLSNLKHYLKN